MGTDKANASAEKIWMDGKLISWNDAQVHVLTHGLHYGLGVFEGIRAYRTQSGHLAVFRLADHMRRLLESAHICQLAMPYNQKQLEEACLELLRAQSTTLKDMVYIRPVAFMGDGAMGLAAVNQTRVAIAAWPWASYLGEEGLSMGIRAKVSSYGRSHINTTMSKAKIAGNYVNSILAKRDAVSSGCDESIFLDVQGYVSEASAENIFVVDRHGTVKTPPLSMPILDGITRDSAIQILRNDMGCKVEEVALTRDELYIAKEVFISGTAAEITPIREVDGRQIGQGGVGPKAKELQERYFKVVRGHYPQHETWLSYV
ncbi:MAG: branched-chain amino acid transaminase [Proteobacteria bacterium]|nr:branched-chain amino acid transaminase [Cystobacterineae bacterium]MCL2258314.1 branched-chain amino acid transaminase [Cystobacterineae bacterium]MCL2314181.1 branched-chain amino acid transaminase [Pseudomonadota bacterium]